MKLNDLTVLPPEGWEKDFRVGSNAITPLQNAIKEDGSWGIRIGVKGGGCSGFLYNMEFIKQEDVDPEEDVVFHSPVNLVIDMFSMEYLKETTLDYVTSLKESGFKFISDKPGRRTCGCGSSFSG